MKIEKIVILGGGVSGCTVAASLASALANTGIALCVIESGQAETENSDVVSLSPYTQVFNESIGLDEAKTLAYTQGAFNLGFHFKGWQRPERQFLQTYGGYGVDFEGIGFQNFYTMLGKNRKLENYDHYSLSAAAALQGKFSHPVDDNKSILSTITYGLNLEGRRYAELLKKYAVARGVVFKSGNFIKAVLTRSGDVHSIELATETITGDFFIDCSGSDAVLINGALGVGNIDWSDYFLSTQCAVFTRPHTGGVPSATGMAAYDNYWIKSVPLRSRSVNTLMFNEKYIRIDELRSLIDSSDIALRPLSHGHREHPWHKNVVSFGPAAITMESFAFSSMDILYRNIQAFIKLLPVDVCCPINAQEYNRIAIETYARLRDYNLCHYLLATRVSDFWHTGSKIPVTPALQQRLDLFRRRGKIIAHDGEMIPTAMWISLLLGFGLDPQACDPLAAVMDNEDLREKIERISTIIARTMEKMPHHLDYLERYLAAQGR